MGYGSFLLGRRKTLVLAAVGALARPRIGRGATAHTLRYVPRANLANLDPIWSTQLISRIHGFMVYDTLYGTDAELRPQPQMAAGHVLEDGDRTCTVVLRDGLRFHDGEPVLAWDCVASLRRWMKRSSLGQTLDAQLDELDAPADRRLRFRLKRPFPSLLAALGSVASPVPFIMPERLARTDPFTQVTEVVGSGPFRFKPDEFVTGSRVAYERSREYVPTVAGSPSLTAGPKVAHFDRVEWHVIPDAATSSAALQTGEVDWFENPSPEVAAQLSRRRNVTVERMDRLPLLGLLRFNHLLPPFDDVHARQALLPAISQADFMTAIVGPDPTMFRDGVGVFPPETSLANDAGLAPLMGPRNNVDLAKRRLRDAGYDGRTVRLIGINEGSIAGAHELAAHVLRDVGLNLDFARRISQPGSAGGRSGSQFRTGAGRCSSRSRQASSWRALQATHRCAPTARGRGRVGPACPGSKRCATRGLMPRTSLGSNVSRPRFRPLPWRSCPSSRSAPTGPIPPYVVT